MDTALLVTYLKSIRQVMEGDGVKLILSKLSPKSFPVGREIFPRLSRRSQVRSMDIARGDHCWRTEKDHKERSEFKVKLQGYSKWFAIYRFVQVNKFIWHIFLEGENCV